MIKVKKGFSLMEIIISIATVALMSGFIIRMFLASTTLNVKAKNIDFSSNYATNVIEEFKSSKSVSKFIESLENVETNGGNYKSIKFFDNNWEELKNDLNASFKMDIHIDLIERIDAEYFSENVTSAVYKINVEVFDARDSKSITDFNTLKFFSFY